MADNPIPYRRLRAILRHYGIVENAGRGKCSHRMFEGVIDGRVVRYPTKCHSEGDEKPAAGVRAIRRAFRLTAQDGINDIDFYSRG